MAETTETAGAPTEAVTPLGVNHLVLNVRDMEESHRFWTEILGFKQVGELHPRDDGRPSMNMRFYSGFRNGEVPHHDVALVERPEIEKPSAEWSMAKGTTAVNHVAICYPDRESWLRQLEHMQQRGVKFHLRVDHGMTHSVYVNDPNGYGVEVLYELPREVWGHDIDGALNYAKVLPRDQALVDDTDYTTSFS